jgi:hypothetical protein
MLVRRFVSFGDDDLVVVLPLVLVAACKLVVPKFDDCLTVVLLVVDEVFDKGWVLRVSEAEVVVLVTGTGRVLRGDNGSVRFTMTADWVVA